MLRRDIQTFPTFIYPHDPWRLVEKRYNPRRMPQMETLFALSNGYLGIRGTFDEGTPVFQKGTLVNGFHETWPIVYPESALRVREHRTDHRQRTGRHTDSALRGRRTVRSRSRHAGRATSALSTCGPGSSNAT